MCYWHYTCFANRDGQVGVCRASKTKKTTQIPPQMLTQERNMKELRGNESPKPCISHSKLLKNTQKCFDILPRAHSAGKAGRDGQAERLLGFLIPSNSHVNHPGTWPPGLVKQHITCSLSRCNIFPLAGYRKAEPHTIWLHKISLDAKSLPLLQAR